MSTRLSSPQGACPLGERNKYFIYFVCIRCNTHAHIRCNIDAYIRCPYTHAYIRCLSAAAGNNGDCTVVLGISAIEQQRCWQRCCT